MNVMPNPLCLKAASTYDAAADHFDHPLLAFWDRHGRRTVEWLGLCPGSRVLDVGCGTGASALPAAATIGPDGHVTGIDVADAMLQRARAKAKAAKLANVTFALADMTALDERQERFDAVISVFSIFFVPDIAGQVAKLWRILRPGGKLAITVWGRSAFEPAASVFGAEVRRARPDWPASPRPWERLTEPANLRRLFLEAGCAAPAVHALADAQRLAHPADWWTIALGSGYRWEIDQLAPAEREAVRARTIERLSQAGVRAIETGALCAVARKGS